MIIAAQLSMSFGETVASLEDPWCMGCGDPPKEFLINGETKPNRMAAIYGPALPKEFQGNYCERCVAMANGLARKRR